MCQFLKIAKKVKITPPYYILHVYRDVLQHLVLQKTDCLWRAKQILFPNFEKGSYLKNCIVQNASETKM